MIKLLAVCFFSLTSCGDNLAPVSQDAGPADANSPPKADGEYIIKVTPTYFACENEPRQAKELYSLANIVSQEDPWKFDLLSRLQGTFVEYDRFSIPWDADGFFSDDRIDNAIFADYPIKIKRFIEGSAQDGIIAFFHRYDIGWDLEDGTYHSTCIYEADIIGAQRYTAWNGTQHKSIDGQWSVRKTVLASPVNFPTGLPYTHMIDMNTLTQTDDGSIFHIDNTFFPMRYVNRNPATGTVDFYTRTILPEVTPTGESQTVNYETKLWGTLLPDTMDLEFSWRWSVVETGEEYWFQHEHYRGAPRYNEHNSSLPEPPQGAYNAEYSLLENDCGIAPYTEHRILDVWPMDDGTVWPKITGFNIEPVVRLGPNGELTMTFSRHADNGSTYTYSFNNSIISGHTADLNMAVDIADIDDIHVCTATYKIIGQKRFESYR